MEINKITVELGGQEFELVLSTLATKHISEKYGGLDKMGKAITTAAGKDLDGIMWLLAELINGGITRENVLKGTQRPLVDANTLAAITTPGDLVQLREAIPAVIVRDTGRTVKVDPPKN